MQLEVQEVSFAYTPGVPVLNAVSFSLGDGTILYLLGRNGSGKTTLLSCITGVLKPDAGQVELDGVDVRSLASPERARRIGLIPQIHVPAFAYSVRQMVLMGRAPHMGLFGSPRPRDYEITDAALEQVGLADYRDRDYTHLSGGERQLVMIARGLAQQCDVLLMDEPDAHLDPNNRLRVMEMVARLRDNGLSFIVSSHAPNSALMYADRVLLLKQGRTLAFGGVDHTLTEPLLSDAYDMATEVIYRSQDGQRSPRAILPRRPGETVSVAPTVSLRTDASLERIFAASDVMPQVVIVTGGSGSGKSAWAADLARRMQAEGKQVEGLLTAPVVKDDQKVGIDLIDLATGERRRLAQRRRTSAAGAIPENWAFDAEVLDWGNDRLIQVSMESDLVVVDELGPLELTFGKGLAQAIMLLDERCFRVTCVVVQEAVIEDALRRWPDAYVVDVDG